jgi:DNA polymerase I-like protein with 3'-5' exonuclease and polymerase domains
MKKKQTVEIKINEPPPIFGPDDWVSMDLECFGMVEPIHRPTGKFASLSVCDGTTAWVLTSSNLNWEIWLSWWVDSVANCNLVMMNAKFDIFHLRRWSDFPDHKKLWDIMLIDKIMWSGYYEHFSLADLARRHLGVYVDKSAREFFPDATEMTQEAIEYNVNDTVYTLQVCQSQRKAIKKTDLKIWYEIDQPTLYAVLRMGGPMVNVEGWRAFIDSFAMRVASFSFPFNANSPAQVKKYITDRKIKLESTGEDKLLSLKSQLEEKKVPDIEIIQLIDNLLEYRKLSKRVSTYGESWLKYVEGDGRVYPNYHINQAETGRFSTSDPSIQTIPIKDTPEFRKFFVAAPGKVLIGGDYGQQEVRVMAYLCADPALLAILNSGRDIYAEIATTIHKRKIEKTDPERKLMKSIVLGLLYGMSEYGLARELHMTVEEATVHLKKFFFTFPVLSSFISQQRQSSKFVKTPIGRKFWLNPYDQGSERNALNSPCQGGASDMIKMAMIYLYQDWDYTLEPYPVILCIHDELVLEVNEENAEYAKTMLETRMIAAGKAIIPGVPVTVDVKVGHSWYETH